MGSERMGIEGMAKGKIYTLNFRLVPQEKNYNNYVTFHIKKNFKCILLQLSCLET